MSLAAQIAAYKARGFTDEHAEVIVLIQIAAGVLFRAFPESFLLFGGATLVLFHESVRHSGDIDLLSRTDDKPTVKALEAALADGLLAAADALNLGPLRFEDVSKTNLDTKLWVNAADGRHLLRVDLSHLGSVIQSEVEERQIKLEDETVAKVKAASRDFLLLQKAECFLLRKFLKTRDAFDIRLLMEAGAALDANLKGHLSDTLMSYEIEREDIIKRIGQVDEKRCRSELQSVLPGPIFDALAGDGFRPLRDKLYELYQDWL